MKVFLSDAMKGCKLSECLHVSLSKCPLESQLRKLEETPPPPPLIMSAAQRHIYGQIMH